MTQENSKKSEMKRTVVEEGTRFKGDLTSTCPVDVRGRVEGEVEAPSLTVSAAGAVHGRAKVGSVRSEGELSGEFEADTVELSGRVLDKTVIRARSLQVKLSSTRGQQVIFGDCELSVGDEPTEHDRVQEPEAPIDQPSAGQPSQPAPAQAAEAAESDSIAPEADVAEQPSDAELDQAAGTLQEALASEADAAGGHKGKRKGGKHNENGSETGSGWSQPPPGE
jgi:cytoskeletal protein CcmA (bactofilin family)